MIKLSKLAEALEAGWSEFRATLFAPSRKPITYVGDDLPLGERGDIWIRTPEMELYIHTGRGWRSLKDRQIPFRKRYLTRKKK